MCMKSMEFHKTWRMALSYGNMLNLEIFEISKSYFICFQFQAA